MRATPKQVLTLLGQGAARRIAETKDFGRDAAQSINAAAWLDDDVRASWERNGGEPLPDDPWQAIWIMAEYS